MLGGLLNSVSGLTGTAFGITSNTYDQVQDTVETVAPGSMDGQTLTGNLLNDKGFVADVLNNAAELNLSGAVTDGYADLIGPGGAVNNLADGGGLGIEGLLGNVLGISDGFLGAGGGLTDGILGGTDGLLG